MNNRQRILIVDDSEMNREILCSMLENLYDIKEARDGVEAIHVLEKSGNEFLVVLLDLVMPQIDGFGVLSYMKKSGLLDIVPVIIISSDHTSEHIAKSFDLGATDFISRPFDVQIVRRRIENTILLHEKQRRLEGIASEEIFERIQNYDKMVSILSQIVEFRNKESGTHVVNIKEITELFAKALVKKTDRYALTACDISTISIASTLHDIGKMAIPDQILNKPDKLTEEEFAIIKTHSREGAKMLEDVNSYSEDRMIHIAHDICMYHHEKFDGNGYPAHLKGDEIPIWAQIVSIADVFDALTSDRCYKHAYTPKKAAEMIQNGECGVFNPLLLECLTELLPKLEAIVSRNAQQNAPQNTEQNDYSDFTNEIAQYHDFPLYARLIRELRYEQEVNSFLQTMLGGIAFSYKQDTSMIYLMPENAKRLAMRERTILTDAAAQLHLDTVQFKENIEHASPEHPDFSIACSIQIDGMLQSCHCICHTIWTNDKKPHNLGCTGFIYIL